MPEDFEEFEEYVNQEFTLKMSAEQFVTVKAVFQTFAEEHGHEPGAKEFIDTLKGLNFERTR